jgi:hypothetical protein
MAGRVTSFNVQGEDYRVEADLQFDSTPTLGSTNPVTSNGIAVALSAVSIGDNISYGRTAGTPIGYCSISYGDNNTATNDYGIVFGARNVVTSSGTIVSGRDNSVYGEGGNNIVMGSGSMVYGIYCSTFGLSNKLGYGFQYISSTNYPSSKKTVYIGYVNASTRKIYSDVDMTAEISVPALIYNDQTGYYFVQIDSGVIYHYYRKNGTYYFVTVQKNNFVNLTNVCHSVSYTYYGPAYYKSSNDRLYSDAAMTSVISLDYGKNAGVWFDINSGKFICRNYIPSIGGGDSYVSTLHYFHIITYIGYNDPQSLRWARRAYVIDTYNADDRWHVYDTNGSDITSELYDGEIIISMAGSPNSHGDITSQYHSGSIYKYIFNTNHDLMVAGRCQMANCSVVYGDNNNIGGGIGAAIFGEGNTVRPGSGGSFVAGSYNYMLTGGDDESDNCNHIIGRDNNITINNPSAGFYPNVIIGTMNNIYGGSTNDSITDATYVIGHRNEISESSKDSTVMGAYNIYGFASNTHTVGQNNEVNFAKQSAVSGYQNIIGRAFYDDPLSDGTAKAIKNAKYLENGYLDIQGENGATSLPTKTLIRISDMVRPDLGKNREELTAFGYSNNGTVLNSISLNIAQARSMYRLEVRGSYNSVIPALSTVISGAPSISDSMVLGQYNVLGGQNISYVNMLGNHLKHRNNGNGNRSSGTIVGSYNDDDNGLGYLSGQKCTFLVGAGTSDNDRKNGLAVMSTGTVAAPSCADTVNGALGGWYGDSRKILITYGMLQDYAPKTPGAIGKPAQTIVTLTAADWSSFEQTVSLSDMTASAVVLIEPSGNPHAYYTDEIYLSSQEAGSLTFGCSVAPTVDISVKVVYWP